MKKLNMTSPLGIALTVAGVVLAVSPEARRAVRKVFVKGTAGMLDTMEQIGGITSSAMHSNQNTSSLPVSSGHPVDASLVSPTTENGGSLTMADHPQQDYH